MALSRQPALHLTRSHLPLSILSKLSASLRGAPTRHISHQRRMIAPLRFLRLPKLPMERQRYQQRVQAILPAGLQTKIASRPVMKTSLMRRHHKAHHADHAGVISSSNRSPRSKRASPSLTITSKSTSICRKKSQIRFASS